MKTLLAGILICLLVSVGFARDDVEPIEITINVCNCELIDVIGTGKCIKCDIETIYKGENQGTVQVIIKVPKEAIEEDETGS